MLAAEVAPGRPRVAILAGLIAAVHPTLVYAATHVQVASLAATLLAACLAWAYRAGPDRARAATPSRPGASSACSPWPTRSWPWSRRGWPGRSRSGRGWRRVGPAGRRWSGRRPRLCVAPWVVRNARVHGEFVPIKSSFGYAFWQGNCALSEGTDKVVRASVERALGRRSGGLRDRNATLWEARHEAGYLDDIALTPADYRELGAVSEPERSRRLFRRALADLRAEPGRYARLCLRRLRYFVFFDETNPKTRSPIYRAGHLGLTALAALGPDPGAGPRSAGGSGRRSLTAALIAAFHALTIVSARFHLPIEPLMALWAAAGRVAVGISPGPADERRRRRGRRRRA